VCGKTLPLAAKFFYAAEQNKSQKQKRNYLPACSLLTLALFLLHALALPFPTHLTLLLPATG
jgi:ABC-type Co2+ transport system permease subunit